MKCIVLQRITLRAAICASFLALGIGNTSILAVYAQDAHEAFFEKEVRPVLAERCYKCHGSTRSEGELRVDSRAALLKGGDQGPALVPGQAEKSLLAAAIRHAGDLNMPPKEKLTESQIAAIVRWIDLGAPWPETAKPAKTDAKHWAFEPVRRPALPKTDPPVENPIDRFVFAKLASAGLAPAPRADPRTLARRASYALTGLPPTAEQVEAFVHDPSPAAYERFVDTLLASPAFGEHWARHWLDVARYSDTKGYVYAREERFQIHSHVYRDWVVRSFNEDLPYDRFLQLQIAADQVAPSDPSTWAAMGFLTLGRRFLGVTHDIIDDRIDVVTRGALGLTVACARCHDHKYDPIPTADYYSLYGVFHGCAERSGRIEPVKSDPAKDPFELELKKRQDKLNEAFQAARTEANQVARSHFAAYLLAQLTPGKFPEEGFDTLLSKDDPIPAFVRRWQAYLSRADSAVESIFGPWKQLSRLQGNQADLALTEPSRQYLLQMSNAHPLVRQALISPALPAHLREVAQRYAALFAEVDKRWQSAVVEAQKAKQPTPSGFPNPQEEALRRVLYAPDSPCVVPDEPIVNTEAFFFTRVTENLWKIQGDVDRWVIQAQAAPAHAVYLTDRPAGANPRVFRRGNPANKGQEVPRQFLAVLSPTGRKPFQTGSGRVELAQAIVDPANPLTRRVMVNRLWLGYFGAGLVRTPSDFGARAEPPSHPELLDWLASELAANGWRLKPIHRLIATSATFQQATRPLAESDPRWAQARRLDPENRLLWRGPVRRLGFEELRDSLLSATGELDRRLGGKPSDLFGGAPTPRRALYGLVDRQFLPPVFRVFDFANPDLHIPQRNETTVPQQALFFLNHPFLRDRSRQLVKQINASGSESQRVIDLYRRAYQRAPTDRELAFAMNYLSAAQAPAPTVVKPTPWQYGYGVYDETKKAVTSFQKLPYFAGDAWQGGPQWPDATLGWAQLTATGGHPGNDLAHAVIRRFVAPMDGVFDVQSQLIHEPPQSDGVRGWIVAGAGLLASATVHNTKKDLNLASVSLKKGDTLDFVVDIGKELSYDQFLWAPTVRTKDGARVWSAKDDFAGVGRSLLNPWEQLAHVILLANEFVFVD